MKLAGPDELDNKIVDLLLHDGRMSLSDIGKQVGLSRTAVRNRMAAMEKSGIIRGYQVVLDPQATKSGMTYVVNLETEAAEFERVAQALAAAPETMKLMQTTGNCHLVAFCYVDSLEIMRVFLRTLYNQTPGILSIKAHAVLDVRKGLLSPGMKQTEVHEHEQNTTAGKNAD